MGSDVTGSHLQVVQGQVTKGPRCVAIVTLTNCRDFPIVMALGDRPISAFVYLPSCCCLGAWVLPLTLASPPAGLSLGPWVLLCFPSHTPLSGLAVPLPPLVTGHTLASMALPSLHLAIECHVPCSLEPGLGAPVAPQVPEA